MDISGIKLPKMTKALKYYYAHREEIAERKKKMREADPVYQEKKRIREEIRRQKEEMLMRVRGVREVEPKKLTTPGQNDQV
jgi:hypothetical protein